MNVYGVIVNKDGEHGKIHRGNDVQMHNFMITGVSRNDLCYIVINKHGTRGSG